MFVAAVEAETPISEAVARDWFNKFLSGSSLSRYYPLTIIPITVGLLCLAGVEYMHEGGLAHLDLSLENCVLGTVTDRGPVIIDMGTVSELAPGVLEHRDVGKTGYKSPEVRSR